MFNVPLATTTRTHYNDKFTDKTGRF